MQKLKAFLHFQVTVTTTVPEIAFTGDTMSDFIVDSDNVDVMRAKILILEVSLSLTITTSDCILMCKVFYAPQWCFSL